MQLQLQLPLPVNYHCTRLQLQLQQQLQLHYLQLPKKKLQLQLQLLQLLQLQLQLRFNYTTTTHLQLQHYNFSNINYTTNTTTLHFATPHYILQLRLRRPLQLLQKSQTLVGPSVDLLCHMCITAIHLSYSFLSLKLPPPPCAVLLVSPYWQHITSQAILSYTASLSPYIESTYPATPSPLPPLPTPTTGWIVILYYLLLNAGPYIYIYINLHTFISTM